MDAMATLNNGAARNPHSQERTTAMLAGNLRWTAYGREGELPLSDALVCIQTVRAMMVATFVRMREALAKNPRNPSQEVWQYAEALECQSRELLNWQALMYFNGVCSSAEETVEYGKTKVPYRPWAIRPLSTPIISASKNFSLEEVRQAREADKRFARRLRDWKAFSSHENL